MVSIAGYVARAAFVPRFLNKVTGSVIVREGGCCWLLGVEIWAGIQGCCAGLNTWRSCRLAVGSLAALWLAEAFCCGIGGMEFWAVICPKRAARATAGVKRVPTTPMQTTSLDDRTRNAQPPSQDSTEMRLLGYLSKISPPSGIAGPAELPGALARRFGRICGNGRSRRTAGAMTKKLRRYADATAARDGHQE